MLVKINKTNTYQWNEAMEESTIIDRDLVELSDAYCRGRNGPFNASRVEVKAGSLEDVLFIDVYSKRVGRTAPIQMTISEAEASELIRALENHRNILRARRAQSS